tara:strand:+ start:142 stop:558 length:417 start_codon:yes stop_codon:yes gene_type:complete
MVAKVDNKFYSIYDANCEYQVGKIKYQMTKPDKKGGYFCYKDVQDAIFADVAFNHGGNFLAPRTILKCICWGDRINYGKKLCFSYILPVTEVGIPQGYRVNGRECAEQAMRDREARVHARLEQRHDINLVRANNFSLE